MNQETARDPQPMAACVGFYYSGGSSSQKRLWQELLTSSYKSTTLLEARSTSPPGIDV